jgi:hypothetical protein
MFNPNAHIIEPSLREISRTYSQSDHYNDDYDIRDYILGNPYLVGTPSFNMVIKTFGLHKPKFLAINRNATHLPQFQELLKKIPLYTEREKSYNNYHHSDSFDFIRNLSENRMLPYSHPEYYNKLIRMDDFHMRKYAFENPSAFHLIYPYVLRKNPNCMVNKGMSPFFMSDSQYHHLRYNKKWYQQDP